MFTKSLPIILSFVSLVAAHGFINEVVINGKTVAGNPIAKTGGNTPIRSVSTQDPMKGADNKDLSCGPGSQPAQSMASINPGDDIEFSWVDLNGGPVRVFQLLLHTSTNFFCRNSGFTSSDLCSLTWAYAARMVLKTAPKSTPPASNGSRLKRLEPKLTVPRGIRLTLVFIFSFMFSYQMSYNLCSSRTES